MKLWLCFVDYFHYFAKCTFYCIYLHQLLRIFCLVISHCNCLCLSLLMYCLFPWVFIVSCLQAHWFYVLILRVAVDFVSMVSCRFWCFLICLSLQFNMIRNAFSFLFVSISIAFCYVIVLYCIVLYCIILCCIVLYRIVLYCIVLYWILL